MGDTSEGGEVEGVTCCDVVVVVELGMTAVGEVLEGGASVVEGLVVVDSVELVLDVSVLDEEVVVVELVIGDSVVDSVVEVEDDVIGSDVVEDEIGEEVDDEEVDDSIELVVTEVDPSSGAEVEDTDVTPSVIESDMMDESVEVK